MTQRGFEEYIYTVFGRTNGTAKSYIIAIRIIDELFFFDDVFDLQGGSIAELNDGELLFNIAKFIREQQTLFINKQESFFKNISPNQRSYPEKRFCSAAIKHLLEYYEYDVRERRASEMIVNQRTGRSVSRALESVFDIDRQGKDSETMVRIRLGQSYFRRMVLANYDNKCCVTGLNVPQTLRASHIVAWAEDKAHRMDPENGLCLSATYDAAFDRHLISFDDDYRMIVSREIKDYYTNDIAKSYFSDFEGKQIFLPIKYMPSKKLLAKHRDCLVG